MSQRFDEKVAGASRAQTGAGLGLLPLAVKHETSPRLINHYTTAADSTRPQPRVINTEIHGSTIRAYDSRSTLFQLALVCKRRCIRCQSTPIAPCMTWAPCGLTTRTPRAHTKLLLGQRITMVDRLRQLQKQRPHALTHPREMATKHAQQPCKKSCGVYVESTEPLRTSLRALTSRATT